MLYWADRSQERIKNLLNRHDEPNKSTKEDPLNLYSISPQGALVSTGSRGHPSLVSLSITVKNKLKLYCHVRTVYTRESIYKQEGLTGQLLSFCCCEGCSQGAEGGAPTPP